MATTYFYESKAVKIYPSSKRSDAYDRNSRLFTEQNIISTVNRLTSRESFVIEGLDITPKYEDNSNTQQLANKFIVRGGRCNIHGYLFNLTDREIDTSDLAKNTSGWLYLSILVKKSTTEVNIDEANKITTTYEELYPVATPVNNNEDNIMLDTSMSLIDTQNNTNETALFKGIILEFNPPRDVLKVVDSNDQSLIKYLLPIGAYTVDNNGVTTLTNLSTVDGGTPWNRAKFDVTDIYIKNDANNVAGSNQGEPQNLHTWLNHNFIIDDGDLDNID